MVPPDATIHNFFDSHVGYFWRLMDTWSLHAPTALQRQTEINSSCERLVNRQNVGAIFRLNIRLEE
jgi:hypothetical protein